MEGHLGELIPQLHTPDWERPRSREVRRASKTWKQHTYSHQMLSSGQVQVVGMARDETKGAVETHS